MSVCPFAVDGLWARALRSYFVEVESSDQVSTEESVMKLLLAIEGSEFSRAAIETCCEIFAGKPETEISILSAAEPVIVPMEPFAVSAEYMADADRAAVENCKSWASSAEATVRSAFPDIGDRLITKVMKDNPIPAILGEAKDWGADLIIMGSHGYGFWKRTFLGSVSNSVVHNAPCSVLIVRPRPEAESG